MGEYWFAKFWNWIKGLIKWLFKKDNKQNKTDNGSAASSGDNSDAINNNQGNGSALINGSNNEINIYRSSEENNPHQSFLGREESKKKLKLLLVRNSEKIACELFRICNTIEIGSRTNQGYGYKIDILPEFEISIESTINLLDIEVVDSISKFKPEYFEFCKELENKFPKYTTRLEFDRAFVLLRDLMNDLAVVLESLDKENQCASALRDLSKLNSSEDYRAKFDRIIQSYSSIKRLY